MAIACSTSVFAGSSLEEALRGIAGLGFRQFDLLAIDGWIHVHTSELAERPDEVYARLDALLAETGLQPLAANTGVGPQLHHRDSATNERRAREIAALVRFLQRYGISIAAIQPRQGDPDRPWEAVLADCVTTLREQFAAGDAAGIDFLLELHVRSPFETLEQARRLVEAMPEVRFVYDPTHYACQGIDLRETEWLMERTGHIHLRDAAPGQLQAPFGAGAVDFDWVLGTLSDRGYAGHFSLEYFPSTDFDVADSVHRLRDKIVEHFPA